MYIKSEPNNFLPSGKRNLFVETEAAAGEEIQKRHKSKFSFFVWEVIVSDQNWKFFAPPQARKDFPEYETKKFEASLFISCRRA